jgi:hypothetical protein
MKVDIEIKDVAGYIATIGGIEYDLLLDLYKKLDDSETIIIWRFSNRDIILNMKNIVNIIVKKKEEP